MTSICVFCGASNGVAQHFFDEGRTFGKQLAEQEMHFVYGGASCGVMGAIADGVLDHGGTVTGVFPTVLDGLDEKVHEHLTETIIVEDMHTRKMHMFNRSDAFVVFPGGFGTMDETFEVITWKQLQTHQKPVVIYNYQGYWDHWIEFTDHIIDNGFASEQTRSMYTVAQTMEEIFQAISE